jgi:Nickel responsive protein SCO4226-like
MATEDGPSTPSSTRRFLVERYSPELTVERMRAGEARARRAAAALTRAGRPVRYIGSLVVEAEETVFSVFEAESPDVIADVNRRAGLPFDRVVPVIELGGPARRPARRTAKPVTDAMGEAR